VAAKSVKTKATKPKKVAGQTKSKKQSPDKKSKKKIVKPAAKKLVKKVTIAKKYQTKKANLSPAKTVKKKLPVKKTANKMPVTISKSKTVTPKNPVSAPSKPNKTVQQKVVQKTIAQPTPNVATNLQTIKKEKKSTRPNIDKAEGWIEQNRVLIVVIFFAVLIMNVWIYITTPKYTPHISEQEILNPVYDAAGVYYKYNVPENEWANFNGKKVIENLVNSGIAFDEATYQIGGQTCDSCPANASPLLYVKNPNHILGGNWQRVDKPGYYENTDRYLIYQYLLSY